MRALLAAIVLVVVALLGLVIFAQVEDRKRVAAGLSILQVDGPGALVPELLDRRCPIVVEAGTAAQAADRVSTWGSKREVLPLPLGAVLVNISDACVIDGADDLELRVVHPIHRPRIEAGAYNGGGGYFRPVTGFDRMDCEYVTVRLQLGSCMVLPCGWTLALEYQGCDATFVKGPVSRCLRL